MGVSSASLTTEHIWFGNTNKWNIPHFSTSASSSHYSNKLRHRIISITCFATNIKSQHIYDKQMH